MPLLPPPSAACEGPTLDTSAIHQPFRPQPKRPPTILVLPLLIGIFFPYLEVVPIGTDLQPTALFFAAITVVLYGTRTTLPRPLILLGSLFLASLGALLISSLDFNSVRSVANYASLCLVTAAVFLVARHRLIRSKWIIDAANGIWLAVGLVQWLYDPRFLSGLLSNLRTTPTRGVVSLAAEPSFYGIISFVFLLLYFLQHRETSIGALLCLLQMLFLAQSPTAVTVLALASIVYFILNCRGKVVLFGGVLVGILWVVSQTPALDQSRLTMLTTWAVENPSELLVRDHSTSARFYHILYSAKGAAGAGFLPHGYSAWARYLDEQMGKNANRYLGYYLETPDRIMSAMGAAFFELGIFAVCIPVALAAGARDFFGSIKNRRAVTFCVATFLVMLNSVPLGFPLYGFLIGYCYSFRATQFVPAGSRAWMRLVRAGCAPVLTGVPVKRWQDASSSSF